jgi:hypothetical protein
MLVLPYASIARLLALPMQNGEYMLAVGLKEPARLGECFLF